MARPVMATSRALITGGAGVIASQLADELPQRGVAHVRAVATGCRLALEVEAAAGGVFNPASGVCGSRLPRGSSRPWFDSAGPSCTGARGGLAGRSGAGEPR